MDKKVLWLIAILGVLFLGGCTDVNSQKCEHIDVQEGYIFSGYYLSQPYCDNDTRYGKYGDCASDKYSAGNMGLYCVFCEPKDFYEYGCRRKLIIKYDNQNIKLKILE